MFLKCIVMMLIAHLVLVSAFSFEAWSQNNFQGTSKTYTQRGTYKPGFTIKSYRWDSLFNDRCCVRMCNNGNDVGYWCQSHSNGLPSSDFNEIVIGYNNEQLVCT
ncbi:44555_t:CDS:1 [Gigaspora margarita]|uniref:44555_t:CDS:1 n=1 Tax=Gigaspora margarita TaxID=4874 RepID=A0ABN7V3P1_GIGMA|nr:44555_t:CDS:1 [Gigaspora margarita]